MIRHRRGIGLAAALLCAALLLGCRSSDGGYPPPGPRFGSDDGSR